MRLTPGYLTTSQSEECPQVDHTGCSSFPYPVFENLSLKAIGSLSVLSTIYLDSLLGTCNKSFTVPEHSLVSAGGLYLSRMSRPKFGLPTVPGHVLLVGK